MAKPCFQKRFDVLNIKRQSDVLRPYNSAGEIAFNSGVGITMKKKKWGQPVLSSYENWMQF